MFMSIHEATMIEKRVSDKPVYFELSIGNGGNNLDGCSTARPSSDDDSDPESGQYVGLLCVLGQESSTGQSRERDTIR